MANLYSSTPYKGRPEPERLLELQRQAEAEHDWECLKPYPILLAWWQGKHPNDLRDISRWVSHFRMPFVPPDYRENPVQLKSGTATYHTGKIRYGHEQCAPLCGTHDYRTGELIEEPLPF